MLITLIRKNLMLNRYGCKSRFKKHGLFQHNVKLIAEASLAPCGKSFDNFSRASHHDGIIWDLHIFGDKRIGTNDAVLPIWALFSTIGTDTNRYYHQRCSRVASPMPNRHAFANGDGDILSSVLYTLFSAHYYFAPNKSAALSARITAPNHTLTLSAKCTSPMISAESATQPVKGADRVVFFILPLVQHIKSL